ncbi:Uncharacterized protein dnm_065330 [Desulfonema magnum]|uniref:Uncharacterized protein n=1 Tax=Desulfonema magnum TaxID=45655 RepID=A0A975BRP6_9BACT|nr:Uncharacterized protein dnm_065330 [Desulfonema magnum]
MSTVYEFREHQINNISRSKFFSEEQKQSKADYFIITDLGETGNPL